MANNIEFEKHFMNMEISIICIWDQKFADAVIMKDCLAF